METTTDAFLGGRVMIRQPVRGFRAGSDAVLLAAAVPALAGARVLDAGTGVGTAALCLAARVPGVTVAGLEVQPVLAALAAGNAAANGMGDRVQIVEGSLVRAPDVLPRNAFDHVMSNPPFFDPAASRVSDDPVLARANAESDLPLADWLRKCLGFLKPGGTLTLIHRAERLGDLLAALSGRAGAVSVFPLWPGGGREGGGRGAKRLLIRAVKDSRAPMDLRPGLLLHDAPERYTAEAAAILRGDAPLVW